MKRGPILVMGAALFAAVFLFAFLNLRSSEQRDVAYHLRKLKQAHSALNPPKSASEAFRLDRIRYTLGRGVPMDDLKNHENRLLELGYFRNTNIAFPSTNLLRAFVMEVRNGAFRDTNWSYSIDGTNVLLTAATFDLHLWAEIASNVNAQASEPPLNAREE